jgi:hypothetical protein
MTREEIIATLEQHIARLENAQADPKLDPNEEDWQLIQDAKEGTTGLLERVREGDKAALREASDLLEIGVDRIFDPLD